jgi:pimeloyl-ACP methyl ester carboxylesterase
MGTRPTPQGPSRVFYAVLSLVAFLFGVLILTVMLRNPQLLVSLGLTGNFYYVPLVLAAATCLFGVLQYLKSAEISPWPSESFYVRNVPTNDCVIIFVHGVTGNSRETWMNDRTKRFWPEMLTEDPAFKGTNVFVYGYDSPRLGQSLTIGELGADLELILSSNGIFTHKRIAFLMHSMGGLVVRSFLTEYARKKYIDNVKLLFFLATPTEGAQVAAVFSLVSQNPQFRQMAPATRANKLGEELRRWLAQNFDIASYAAYETEKTSGTVVVPMANALALSNRPAYPISNANHVTITKPDDDKAPQYLAFRQAFKKEMAIRACLLKGLVIAGEENGPALKNPRVTVLGPAHAKIDREMVKRLRNVCSERTMQIFFYETNYALGFDEEIPRVLLRLYYGLWKQVDCHFLDPSLESLFAEFSARVLVMIEALNQITKFRGSELWYPKLGVSLDEQKYRTFVQCVSRANNAASDLYKSYGELIHECRLRLEISTLDEL